MSKKSSAVSPDEDVILVGGGGHARVVLSVLERLGTRILGYTAIEESADFPCTYLGTDKALFQDDLPSDQALVMGLGLPAPNPNRLALLQRFIAAGFRFPAVVAPGSIVSADVGLCQATTVLDGAIVAIGSHLGVGCIINHNVSVDHECVIGDNTHIAPGATICGGVRIESNSFVGAGATIVPGVRIAGNCVVAAGATVTANTEADSMYAGCPARRIR